MDFRSNIQPRVSRWSALSLVSFSLALLPSSACVLVGVEPDEIDLANGSETGGAEYGGTDEGGSSATGDTGEGDGDGDPGTSGDGDGDQDSGDGDGDPVDSLPCADLEVLDLELGPNDVTIAPGASVIAASCGADGPEQVYRFEPNADTDVTVQFALNGSDFESAIYAIDGEVCVPPVELVCATELIEVPVLAGAGVYVVVDSAVDGGTATLDVSILP